MHGEGQQLLPFSVSVPILDNRCPLMYPSPMTLTILAWYLAVLTFEHLLRIMNLKHLRRHGTTVPDGFAGAVDEGSLRTATAYTLDRSRLGIVESLVDSGLLVGFLFAGILPLFDRWVASLTTSFILAGVVFFLLLSLVQSAIAIPFGLYETFVIERRYGFTTTTPMLWWSDLLKSTCISMTLATLMISGAFALVAWSPLHWWLWVWGFLAFLTLFLMYLSPYVIEPLFNRYEPVKTEGLEEEIRVMVERAGLRVSRVMQVDASRRSRHSNAYFTGIGRVKRIVLYDTLLNQMTHAEILAVLAHEIGHWKLGHIRRRIIAGQAGALAAAWLAWRVTSWEGLPGLLGMTDATFPARLVIVGFIGTLALFPLTPLFAWLSRRQEREADRFAVELCEDPASLATALVKLSRENLSNLHPHPLYAAFHYSHPPVVERVQALLALARKE